MLYYGSYSQSVYVNTGVKHQWRRSSVRLFTISNTCSRMRTLALYYILFCITHKKSSFCVYFILKQLFLRNKTQTISVFMPLGHDKPLWPNNFCTNRKYNWFGHNLFRRSLEEQYFRIQVIQKTSLTIVFHATMQYLCWNESWNKKEGGPLSMNPEQS